MHNFPGLTPAQSWLEYSVATSFVASFKHVVVLSTREISFEVSLLGGSLRTEHLKWTVLQFIVITSDGYEMILGDVMELILVPRSYFRKEVVINRR